MSRTADQARHVLADSHVVAAGIDAALNALHDSRGGYPTSTPGAGPLDPTPRTIPHGRCLELGRAIHCDHRRPCKDHDPRDADPTVYTGRCGALIRTEPGTCLAARPCPDHDGPVALTQPESLAITPDRSRLDELALKRAIRNAARNTQRAAEIVARWANNAGTETSNKQKLADGDHGIWCGNCATHGVNNVCREGRRECAFCAEFRRTWGTPPNRSILDIHARRAVTNNDVIRILDRDCPGWRKTQPRPKANKRKTNVA